MDDVRVGPTVTIPAAELAWRFSRSSGAGGQHVNTTDSRVELTWDLERSAALTDAQRGAGPAPAGGALVDGTLTVTASERRSQLRNREAAMERLAELVAGAIEPRRRRAGRPSRRRRPRAPPRRQAPPSDTSASPATAGLSPHGGFLRRRPSRWSVRSILGPGVGCVLTTVVTNAPTERTQMAAQH